MRVVVQCAAWLAGAATPMVAQSAGALGHYDLAQPARTLRLPAALAEVSGITFTPDGRLLAHGDEDASIWQLDPETGAPLGAFALGEGGGALIGDFEDIQVVGGRVYLVTSKGELYEGAMAGNGRVSPAVRRSAGVGGACEVEGLSYDAATRAFLLLCKELRGKGRKDDLVILAVSAETGRLEPAPRITVPADALTGATGQKRFNGSALVRHPGTGTYLVVAGPQRAYAEIDSTGRVLGGGRLDRDRHPQPEGLAVAPDRTLFISDEGGGGHATITAYAWRP